MKKQLFVVRPSKLIFLLIISGGIYSYYWFYKNWEAINENTGKNLNESIRSLFFHFTSYWFFKNINKIGQEVGIKQKIPTGFYGLSIFFLIIIQLIPVPYSLISLVFIVIIYSANNHIALINEKINPDFEISEKLQGWNWVLIIFGFIMWIGLISLILKEISKFY